MAPVASIAFIAIVLVSLGASTSEPRCMVSLDAFSETALFQKSLKFSQRSVVKSTVTTGTTTKCKNTKCSPKKQGPNDCSNVFVSEEDAPESVVVAWKGVKMYKIDKAVATGAGSANECAEVYKLVSIKDLHQNIEMDLDQSKEVRCIRQSEERTGLFLQKTPVTLMRSCLSCDCQAYEPELSPRLNEFLRRSWRDCASMHHNDKQWQQKCLYENYVTDGKLIKQDNVDFKTLNALLQKLGQITKDNHGVKVRFQGALSFDSDKYLAPGDTSGSGALSSSTLDELRLSFYHFQNSNAEGLVKYRMYVHIRNPEEAMACVAKLVPLYASEKWKNVIKNIKIAGTQNYDRADTMVIYLISVAQQDTLAQIVEEKCGGGLAAGVPAIMRTRGESIGFADEPPHALMRTLSTGSFGSVYGKIISEAIYSTISTNGNYDAFVAKVKDLLRTYAISPNAPEKLRFAS